MKLLYTFCFILSIQLIACQKADLLKTNELEVCQGPAEEGAQLPSTLPNNNAGNNQISNPQSLVGQVLYFDKKLIITNVNSCASCHKQFHEKNIQKVAKLAGSCSYGKF